MNTASRCLQNGPTMRSLGMELQLVDQCAVAALVGPAGLGESEPVNLQDTTTRNVRVGDNRLKRAGPTAYVPRRVAAR